MPRLPRKKGLSNIHHVMNRSINEIQLYRDSHDKDKFLNIIRKYQKIYLFVIYSYVLMDTHYHLQIYSNGSDISKFMKSINQSYAQYYNRKYGRHGHVFADRFKSKPIENDAYAITVSAYIHNNPRDIKSFEKHIENYKYSSLQTYAGLSSKNADIIDTSFILKYFSNNLYRAKKSYLELVCKSTNSAPNSEIEFTEKETCYSGKKHILIRDFKVEDIINFVSNYAKEDFCIHAKYNHRNSVIKSVCLVLLRSFCNLSIEELGMIVGNNTCSNIWRLCEKGLFLINNDNNYKNIVKDFIEHNKSA